GPGMADQWRVGRHPVCAWTDLTFFAFVRSRHRHQAVAPAEEHTREIYHSAVLVLEEDVDGGGGAAVHMRVPAPGHVFHETDVAGAKHVSGPITGANLDFPGQMNDQPAFGQGVE